MTRPTKEQIDELLAFLPALEATGRSFGEERGSEKQPDGSITFPWVDYSPDVVEFFHCASQPWFLDVEYVGKNPGDWLENPEFIQTAGLEQLITLLTFCNRIERFNDGAWKDALERGIIQNILRRMAELSEA